MKKLIPIFLMLTLTACNAKVTEESNSENETTTNSSNELWKEDLEQNKVDSLAFKSADKIIKTEKSELEKRLIQAGLIDVQALDSSIEVDVKYATKDNFMGSVLYDGYDKVYLQPEVAERLSKAQKALKY